MAKDIIISEKKPFTSMVKREDILYPRSVHLANESLISLCLTDRAVYKLARHLKLKEAILGETEIHQSPSDMLVLRLLRALKKGKCHATILASDLGINNDNVLIKKANKIT